ncbi:MAG: CDGSH iron-sulfur domain-containing protein [SAR202 cluster bacterium]|nr:CDGSH iron-sulfur domain-containing protein [SAR202 cluster bacterium]
MAGDEQKITIRPNGPYLLRGGIPLVRKSEVMSEHGEPLTWKKDGVLESDETTRLCRCGKSQTKPFCDSSHTLVAFDGTETADPAPIASRAKEFKGEKIVMKDDHSLCVHSGFCGNRVTNLWNMVKESGDTQVRAQMMAMIEKCPSGTLAFSVDNSPELVEPDLPREVAVITDGPLWVSGGITIERRDGKPVETRNRITLCRCGASANKPFCDGAHKEVGFTDGINTSPVIQIT